MVEGGHEGRGEAIVTHLSPIPADLPPEVYGALSLAARHRGLAGGRALSWGYRHRRQATRLAIDKRHERSAMRLEARARRILEKRGMGA